MAKRTAKPKVTTSPSTTPEALRLPATKPRNPVAIDPLLKKSGAHGDQRRKRALAEDQAFTEAVKDMRRTSHGGRADERD